MKNRSNLPFGIKIIVIFYIFGALVLFLTMFTNYAEVAEQITLRHGLPLELKFVVLPAVVLLALGMSYGLFSHSRWGYFLTLIYQVYFGAVSLILFLSASGENLVFIGSFLWSLAVVIYLILKRRVFIVPVSA